MGIALACDFVQVASGLVWENQCDLVSFVFPPALMLVELLFVHHFEFLGAVLQFKATRSWFGPCVWVCIQTFNCIQISLVSEESFFSWSQQLSNVLLSTVRLAGWQLWERIIFSVNCPKLPVPSPLWGPRLPAASRKLVPSQLVWRCMLMLCWLGPPLQICSTPIPPWLLSVCYWLFLVSEPNLVLEEYPVGISLVWCREACSSRYSY